MIATTPPLLVQCWKRSTSNGRARHGAALNISMAKAALKRVAQKVRRCRGWFPRLKAEGLIEVRRKRARAVLTMSCFRRMRRLMRLTPAVVGGSFCGDELGGIGCGRM